ncbi:MAG: class I SAM-dependent methyltransferase [Candidatus Hodarchaeales archaeon]
MNKKTHYNEIARCRICGNTDLKSIFYLGEMALTGIFSYSTQAEISSGPLELVKCVEEPAKNNCGLVQLRHTYNISEMYSEHYGYRSGLNSSMMRHLEEIVVKTLNLVSIEENDLVIDIGSNDATLLKSYPSNPGTMVGIDPIIQKFESFYPANIIKIPDFYRAEHVKNRFGKRKAKIITSIAMFYDLESPLDFVKDINEILDDEGVWVFEQSYMPLMIKRNAYDTICHEHLEYYCLKQIMWMLEKVGFKIIQIEMNEINGGSFMITAAKQSSKHMPCNKTIEDILEKETVYSTFSPYEQFKDNIERHRDELIGLLKRLTNENKRVFGYGASTKGNVLLQYCNISTNELECIAEVNEEKFGAFTPRTQIPIIQEKIAREMKPDYFLVLPWHFKEHILKKEAESLKNGIRFIFPLPHIEIY